jgi:hypothetical protein
MSTPPCESLLAAFARLTHPRRRRGIGHPCAGLLALTFLGPLRRRADSAAIARRAERHRDRLREPPGFNRRYAPHAAVLTSADWRCPDLPWLARALDAIADPAEFGPAAGDPTIATALQAARILGGTCEPAELPGPVGDIVD